MKRGWEKMHQLRMERWVTIKNKAENEIKNLLKKEIFILGVALYSAEGAKEKEHRSATNIKFSNSDVKMLLVFRKWLNEFFVIPKENIKYELYIHEKADLVSAKKFWEVKKNMLIRLARWFEWVFGMLLMTTITVATSLNFLTGFNRWALLIGLLLFFVASLIVQLDNAGKG